MRYGKLLGLAAVTLALLARPARAQTTLRYQFKNGDKLQYALTQDMKMSMSFAGKDFEVTIKQALDMDWDVESVDAGGNARVRLKFGRVKLAMGSPAGSAEYDSAAKQNVEPDNPVGKVLIQMGQVTAALQMTFIMAPNGVLKDIKVPDDILKKLQAVPGAEKFGADLLTPEGLSKIIGGGLVLPSEPVKKGESWKQKTSLKLQAAKLAGEVAYTYDGPAEKDGRKVEKIAVKPDLRVDNDADAKIQIKLKAQQDQGEAYFDNQAGRLVEATSAGRMDLEVGADGTTISQRITQSSTLRLKGRSRPR